MKFIFLIFIQSCTFIPGLVPVLLAQHSLKVGIVTAIGGNIPGAKPLMYVDHHPRPLKAGKNLSAGMDILYERSGWGIQSVLLVCDQTMFDPNTTESLNGDFLTNFLGWSCSLDITSANLRMLAFKFNNDTTHRNTKYIVGASCLKSFTTNYSTDVGMHTPIQTSIVLGIEFKLFSGDRGEMWMGFLYDYCLTRKVFLSFHENKDHLNSLEFGRNNILRLQLNYHFQKGHRKQVKTPRYHVE